MTTHSSESSPAGAAPDTTANQRTFQVRYAEALERVEPLIELMNWWETKPEKDADGKPTSHWQRLAYAALAAHKLAEWMDEVAAEGLDEDIEFDDPLEDDALEVDAHQALVNCYCDVDSELANFAASLA